MARRRQAHALVVVDPEVAARRDRRLRGFARTAMASDEPVTGRWAALLAARWAPDLEAVIDELGLRAEADRLLACLERAAT